MRCGPDSGILFSGFFKEAGEDSLLNFKVRFRVKHKPDSFQRLERGDDLKDCPERDLRRIPHWVAKYSRGDGRKSDGVDPMLFRKADGVSVTISQDFGFGLVHTVNRSQAVNDERVGKLMASGDDRLSRLDGRQWPAFLLDPRPRGCGG